MSDQKRYSLNILGEDYFIVSDEDGETLARAAGMVDEFMKEAVSKPGHGGDNYKAAILVALQLANRLVHLEASLEGRESQIAALADLVDQEELST